MQALITTREAAQQLGVSEAFLERARWSGHPAIPYVQVGSRCVRYDPAQLQKYLQSKIRTSTSDLQAA